MDIPSARQLRNPLAALYLHLAAVVCGINTVVVTAQQVLPPPHLQLLSSRATTTGRTLPPTTVLTVAAIVLFVLVLFCVLINQWRRSSSSATDADADARSSIRRRRRRRGGGGLDPAALAALPIVPYPAIRKHKMSSSGGAAGELVLECAVCLTAFDDGDDDEVLRLLPQCSHAFHPDCIDPWLLDHVTCPLCRANLENPVPVSRSSSPETETKPPQTTLEAAVVDMVDNDDGDERAEDEAVELEKLRCVRRAAATARMMMLRSRSTGHYSTSTAAAAAAETTTAGGHDDHERFTVRLPPDVLAEAVESRRRLRHAASLVIRLGGGASSNCGQGSSGVCGVRGERCPGGARRRWPSTTSSLLASTASWALSVAEGSAAAARRGGVAPAAAPDGGTNKPPPCGHVLCSVARWPERCKAARNWA